MREIETDSEHASLEARAESEERELQRKHKGKSEEVFHELTVAYANQKIRRILPNGQEVVDTVKLRSYNGQSVGPTIEVEPGDTLRIILKNKLPFVPELAGTHPHNGPHGAHVTNLHFHGLHVSPAGNSDNVLIEVGPNQQYEYEVKIPHDHPPGTHWYHAHKHGAVGIQLGSGMAGPLIVRGGLDDIDEIRDAKERILVLQQLPYREVTDPNDPTHTQKALMVEEFDQLFEFIWQTVLMPQGRRTTINGETIPTFKLQPGEVEYWRLIHSGIHFPLRLRLVREGANPATDSIPFYVIAHDGITTGRLDKVEVTELHPGYRTDILVQGVGKDGKPLPKGNYLLVDEVALGMAQGAQPPIPLPGVVARVEVNGSKKTMKLPKVQDLAELVPYEPITDDQLTSTTPQPAHFEVQMVQGLPNPIFKFLINGKEFDFHGETRKLTLGAVEEWVVSSKGAGELFPGSGDPFPGHPFHIHTNPFHFTDEQGRIIWKDTIFVPNDTQIVLRTRYKRYTGIFMLHCHIVSHEDEGMMQMLEIVMPPPDAGGPPGGAHHDDSGDGDSGGSGTHH